MTDHLKPSIWISSITLNDGKTIELQSSDIVVIVGANNSGKSLTLRELYELVQRGKKESLIAKDIQLGKIGSTEDLFKWIKQTKYEKDSLHFHGLNQSGGHKNDIESWWQYYKNGLYGICNFFCCYLGAQERLSLSQPASNFRAGQEPAQNPIQLLYENPELEYLISGYFKEAFGLDLIVNRAGGTQIPLHVGIRESCNPQGQEDKTKYLLEYQKKISKLPFLHAQGDGMRSFSAVILNTLVQSETIVLLDEPEAFLHPPQARVLGRMLVDKLPNERQLFIATHSGDVLKGLIETGAKRIQVIRLRRSMDINPAALLKSNDVKELWSDPLLRSSNILDGLFHSRVVLCESDGDCRFYSAILDAVIEKNKGVKPDIMFTHCNGKHRLHVAAQALRKLDVPTSVVPDFDVLNDAAVLKRLVESVGGNWDEYATDWKVVKNAVDQKHPPLRREEVERDIQKILSGSSAESLTEDETKKIKAALKRTSPWASVKESGVSVLPGGEPTQSCNSLLLGLEKLGIFVVRVGELESFEKNIGPNNKSEWLDKVLEYDLASDVRLKDAREFVLKISGIPNDINSLK